jgi:hypothetical protein
MPRYRFPHPSEYGTRQAVTATECPVCHERYYTLKQPLFITDDLGTLILTYKVGQLICDWCLKRNCRLLHLKIQMV